MFTGIIEEIGIIENINKGPLSIKLTIKAKKVLEDTNIGDSISTNGVCLTVTELTPSSFIADVMIQTMNNTNLSSLKIGDFVNLERAIKLNQRFGGHIVSGHIDGIGLIKNIESIDIATKVTISTNSELLKFIVSKGSIAIDGTSLTVAHVTESDFSVFIIPHTSEKTSLLSKSIGSTVNLETDILAKYIEKILSFNKNTPKNDISISFLQENGFI